MIKLLALRQHSKFSIFFRHFVRNLREISFKVAPGAILASSLLVIPKNNVVEKCKDLNVSVKVYSKRDILKIILNHPLDLLISIISAIFAAVSSVKISLNIGFLIEKLKNFRINDENFLESMKPNLLQIAYFILLQSLSTAINIISMDNLGEKFANELKSKIFENIIYQDVAFFDDMKSSTIISRIEEDVSQLKNSIKSTFLVGLKSSVQLISGTYELFNLSPKLTTGIITSLPLLFGFGGMFASSLRRLSSRVKEKNEENLSLVEESLRLIRTVKSLSMESIQIEKYNEKLTEHANLHYQFGVGLGIFLGLNVLLIHGLTFIVIFLGGSMVNKGQMTEGDLVAYLLCSQNLQRSFSQLTAMSSSIVNGFSSMERVKICLNLPLGRTNPKSDSTQIENQLAEYTIHFKDISFEYDTRKNHPVFQGLSLTIPQGQHVAIVGKTGSGKSTLISLLQRFYDPSYGQILIGSVPTSSIKVSDLRGDLISHLSQEPELFHTTVYENVKCYRPSATHEEVVNACKLADAHEFIMNDLPKNYDTIIGGGSGTEASGLSGGQKQRIVLARCLLKNSPILVMDEATSNLDQKTEAIIQKAIEENMKDKTIITIAHRLSTIQKADRIIYLENGKIVEDGTHKELMKKQGYYYNLVKSSIKQ